MGILQLDGVTHWSIPVNDLEEAEKFYQEVLGLEHKGRLGSSTMSCFTLGGHFILLCGRKETIVRTPQQDNRLHHAFHVSPAMFEKACRFFQEKGIRIGQPIVYRERATSRGESLTSWIQAGTCWSCRIQRGNRGCPHPLAKKSLGPEVGSQRAMDPPRIHLVVRVVLLATVIGGVVVPVSAGATILAPKVVTCPVDGKKFTVQVIASTNFQGMDRDFRRRTTGISFYEVIVWTCPGNYYSGYRGDFAVNLDEALKKTIRGELRPRVKLGLIDLGPFRIGSSSIWAQYELRREGVRMEGRA